MAKLKTDIQPSVVVSNNGDTRTYTHPAFGQVMLNRVSGRTVLYGTDFEHDHWIALRIKRSELNRHLAHDWMHERDEIIEVALSEAQWARLVSSVGVGAGVPCTIKSIYGSQRSTIPLRQQKSETESELRELLRNAEAHVLEAMDSVQDELSGLSKAKKDKIMHHLSRLQRELSDHIPFVKRSFDRHMEEVVEEARMEVNAYATATARLAGIAEGKTPAALPAGPSVPEYEEEERPDPVG